MNILVSGASIAGPALAALLVDRGHDVTVVERAPSLRTGGYAIDVRGAALHVLEELGLRERIRAFETDTERNICVDGRGRKLASMPRGFGVIDPGDVEIRRGDLARLLIERSGARYRFGTSIVALHEDERGVDVRFSDDSEHRYDLVVAADGVRSTTRALAGIEVTQRDLGAGGEGCIGVAVWSSPNDLGLHREQLLYFEPGVVASIKSQRGDERVDTVVFYATTREHVADRERLAVQLARWPYPTLVRSIGDDFYCDVVSQIIAPRYCSKRVALLGDAAWCPTPLSGQGSSLALVGAHVLAATLDDDVPTSLARYDAKVRPFIERNLVVAEKIGADIMPSGRLAAWARVQGMRMIGRMPFAAAMMRWAMRDVVRASRAIDLA